MQGFYNKPKKKFARESRFNVMEKTNLRIFAYILRRSLQTNWVQIQNRIRSASPKYAPGSNAIEPELISA
ncbi:hypothetical protein HMPREF3213_00318 [Heyndrickxia coagulans]|uniref:Uncharacterized protein n=1 Tax=Heyndrickxia coagulans TaxID=1398 RepID=A0A133L1J1_HEYCO|nr:hypothetical protein HMPREF3213_00318 [Heyndrickxia coagulans]